jgi:non-ribosomal peptide synthetase component F
MQQNYEGGEYSFVLDKELTANLKREISGKDVTLFMMLIAAYYVLLSRLSGKDDIIIGVPVPGRVHDDLRKLIGMFVNLVAIRNRPRMSITFEEFLEEVKQNSLAAFSNQDFQFELIFDKLKLDRDLSKYPLFNTVFNMPDMGRIESKSISIKNSKLVDLSGLNKKTSRYDISVYALDLGERIEFICTYRICLFKRSTIEYIMGEYIKLIEQIMDDRNKFLKDYRIFV